MAMGDDGPSDLYRGIMGERGRGRIAFVVKPQAGIGQKGGHKGGNAGDDDQQIIVQPDQVPHQIRRGRLKANAPIHRLADNFQVFSRAVWAIAPPAMLIIAAVVKADKIRIRDPIRLGRV